MFDTDAPLERLPGESARAHTALLAYAELGPERSLAKLAQLWGKSRSYVGQLERWSARHRWQERVAAYDAQLARRALEHAADQYIADIIAHQDRYRTTGRELHAVARSMLSKLTVALQHNELTFSVGDLYTIVKTFQAAAELEAHALSLDRLLPMLDVANEQGHPFDSADYKGAAR
jgi:hypothetical protein